MNLPKADWGQGQVIDELGRLMNEYQAACRNQFRALTFTHDLCLDDESGGYKVGEATLLVRISERQGVYGCFWLGHQDAQHCYFDHIPFLDVIPKPITLKRAVVKIYEDAVMKVVTLLFKEEGEPDDLATAWLMDTDGGFCIRTKNGAVDPMSFADTSKLLLIHEDFAEGKIFTTSEGLGYLEGELFEYSFPPA